MPRWTDCALASCTCPPTYQKPSGLSHVWSHFLEPFSASLFAGTFPHNFSRKKTLGTLHVTMKNLPWNLSCSRHFSNLQSGCILPPQTVRSKQWKLQTALATSSSEQLTVSSLVISLGPVVPWAGQHLRRAVCTILKMLHSPGWVRDRRRWLPVWRVRWASRGQQPVQTSLARSQPLPPQLCGSLHSESLWLTFLGEHTCYCRGSAAARLQAWGA